MSMWLDQKYVGILSIHLDQFKRKGSSDFNFRCPVCGDSKKSKTKARGYIFPRKGGLFYHCHNCLVGMSLGNLIKHVNSNLYKEYQLERYSEGDTGRKPHKDHGYVFKPLKFGNSQTETLFNRIVTPIKNLSEGHEIVEYVRSRKIPEDRYNTLYYVENIQDLKKLAPGYEDKIITNEPRMVLPFYNKNNKLVGLTARGIRGEQFRYLNLKIDEDDPMIFGIHNIDLTKPIYVTEGPIDSLFLPNSVASGNANLRIVADHLPKDKLVLIYDNEPRNDQIVKNMQRAIDEGFSLCIWPKSYCEKDINDMIVKSSTELNELISTIEARTFSGPRLMLEFNGWRI